jgi:hypothetical protein
MKHLLVLLTILFFSACTTPNEKLTIVQKDGKYGVVNQNNQFVIKNIFEYIYPFNHNGYAVVKATNRKFGVIDKNNNLKLDTIYNQIGKFYNNRAIIQLNNKFGIIDNNYNTISKPLFSYIEDFIFPTSIFKMNEKFGCITKDGMIKLKPIYSSIVRKTNNAFIKNNDKWGVIDNNCNITVPTLYEQIELIDDEIIKVKLNNKNYILDKKGKLTDF